MLLRSSLLVLCWLSLLVPAWAAPTGDRVDFNRDIRPLLSDTCFQCHGPDPKTRKADLRLDIRAGAVEDRGGTAAIVPGKPEQSEMLARLTTTDATERMPPAKTGKKLTDAQVQLIRRWIEQGAEFKGHWSFIPPTRPALPAVKDAGWVRTPIDRFILARLEREGLRPSAVADRVTLIRRLTLDLTGLPPTPAEVDAFLADTRPDAYEQLVDRLLGSARYGERMALEWLDAARFADTHGFHIDSGRDMTRWRDWVIDAFNSNKPFDQFTIEQIAGDLLPDATVAQKVASGFHRNHMINYEGGAIPAEYHNAYIVDRVNTTATVWLGLALACAQCHDHKYDPFTQKEYYQLYAFFHNVPESGLDGRKGNAAPVLRSPRPEQQRQLDELAASISALEKKLAGPLPEVDAAQAAWEKTAASAKTIWHVVEPSKLQAKGGAVFNRQEDRSFVVSGPNPARDVYTLTVRSGLAQLTALRVEALPDKHLNGSGPGRSVNGNFVLTGVAVSVKESGKQQPLAVRATSADFSQDRFPAAGLLRKGGPGWAIHPQVGSSHALVIELAEPLAGEDQVLTLELRFDSSFGQHQIGRLRLGVTDSPTPHQAEGLSGQLRAILALPVEERSEVQKAELRTYYRGKVSAEMKKWNGELADLRKSLADTEASIPSTMVMQEMPQPRDTFVLVRGQYDKKGEKVQAGVPAALPPLPKNAPPNRLGLARWLVQPDQPLTARVIVNRYWQMYFGTGLVKTSEDFGSQGDWPTHPELLDWLACEFREGGWNIKQMQRLIVTSATYRQTSAVTPVLLARDPDNRLLARMSRLRLQAEFLRDQALAVSGLLNGTIGGASVSPYQPAGIWEELGYRADFRNFSAQIYEQSKGKDLYRRTMYTFWKRTAPPPSLMTLDAPDRETCTVRRSRTNTPLQALVLLNDPTYVEASRKLAERVLREGGSKAEDRLTLAFRLAVVRQPRAAELVVLQRILDRQLALYHKDQAAALKLLSVGESPRDDKLEPAEAAAWAVVANAILNLDETLTRN